MSDYVANFSELPFHLQELKFVGYIRDTGTWTVRFIQEVAKVNYGFKVCGGSVSSFSFFSSLTFILAS